MNPAPLFDYMRERYEILLRRKAGLPGPWTEDYHLQTWRYCNVFREDDRTTIWFRENVRERYDGQPSTLLLATVVFRWFNRIETGEAIFQQKSLGLGGEEAGETAFDAFARLGDVGSLRASVLQYCGRGPYVTGAYIIKTPDGMNKLDGVLWCISRFFESKVSESSTRMEFQDVAQDMMRRQWTLEETWNWLRRFPYLGDFMSFEIVTDLRHTSLLRSAPDIYTWANPGPGAMRGLNRLSGRDVDFRQPKNKFIEEMQQLLFIANDPEMWPRKYPTLEMRDIEHSLCELSKYERAREGGRNKQTYP